MSLPSQINTVFHCLNWYMVYSISSDVCTIWLSLLLHSLSLPPLFVLPFSPIPHFFSLGLSPNLLQDRGPIWGMQWSDLWHMSPHTPMHTAALVADQDTSVDRGPLRVWRKKVRWIAQMNKGLSCRPYKVHMQRHCVGTRELHRMLVSLEETRLSKQRMKMQPACGCVHILGELQSAQFSAEVFIVATHSQLSISNTARGLRKRRRPFTRKSKRDRTKRNIEKWWRL